MPSKQPRSGCSSYALLAQRVLYALCPNPRQRAYALLAQRVLYVLCSPAQRAWWLTTMKQKKSHVIYVIRHGESQANAGQRTSDPATTPLTEHGHQQAQQVADTFIQAPQLIVTSSYLRTIQTAAPTCRRFPDVPCEVWPIHEFTYISPQRCINTTAAERQPLVAEYWSRCDPNFIDGPGAESWARLFERASATLQRLESYSSVAFFSHGQFIQMLLYLLAHPASSPSVHSMRAVRNSIHSNPIHNAQILCLENLF